MAEITEPGSYTPHGVATRTHARNKLLAKGWPEDLVEQHLEKSYPALPATSNIYIKGVSKSFNRVRVLDNINLKIHAGEILGIIGLSGAGKTTLLNIIVGFVEPNSGDVLLLTDKEPVSFLKHRMIIKQWFGFSTQIPSFYEKLTVKENLAHFAALYNLPYHERVSRAEELIKLVGLKESEHQLAQNLSGGMQKRLDIACSMINNPKLLILDEPTADLDPVMRQQVWDIVREINKRGTTVVIASHFLGEIERITSRIALLHNKTIVDVGTPAKLRELHSNHYTVCVTTEKKAYKQLVEALKRKKGLIMKVQQNDELVLFTKKPEMLVQAILTVLKRSNDTLQELRVSRSIREIFEALVK